MNNSVFEDDWRQFRRWLFAFGALFLFAMRGRLLGLGHLWLVDGVNGVGALVPIISGALMWRKRRQLQALRLEPNRAGLLLLLISTGGAGMLPLGLLFVLYWSGFALLMGGFKLLRELAFPLALLLFTVPIPLSILNLIDYPLQMISASITARLAGMVGVQVIQQGPTLEMPHSQIFVAPECNGMRSAAALFLIGLVAAHIAEGPLWGKGLLPILGICLAYLSNLSRLFINVMVTNALGSSSWLEYEVTYDRIIGLITFIAACLLVARFIPILKCRVHLFSAA